MKRHWEVLRDLALTQEERAQYEELKATLEPFKKKQKIHKSASLYASYLWKWFEEITDMGETTSSGEEVEQKLNTTESKPLFDYELVNSLICHAILKPNCNWLTCGVQTDDHKGIRVDRYEFYVPLGANEISSEWMYTYHDGYEENLRRGTCETLETRKEKATKQIHELNTQYRDLERGIFDASDFLKEGETISTVDKAILYKRALSHFYKICVCICYDLVVENIFHFDMRKYQKGGLWVI